MEEFIQRLTALLHHHFAGSELEFEIAGPRRVGGLVVWEGFAGQDHLERQRAMWKMLRAELTPEEQLQVSALLTLTPEEMAVAREA